MRDDRYLVHSQGKLDSVDTLKFLQDFCSKPKQETPRIDLWLKLCSKRGLRHKSSVSLELNRLNFMKMINDKS